MQRSSREDTAVPRCVKASSLLLCPRRNGRRTSLLGCGPLAILLTVMLASCDPAPRGELIGVSTTDAGSGLTIHCLPCGSELVVRVALLRQVGQFADDADDEVLWEIRSASGAPRPSFTVGAVPGDFNLTVPMKPHALQASPLLVVVETTRGSALTSRGSALTRVDLTRLESGRVQSGGEELRPSEFLQRSAEACEPRQLATWPPGDP
jgi:hypothetical protein